MKTRSLFTNISFALFSIGLVVWPLLTLSPIASGMVKNFIFGNATTQGKVLYVGPSTVGKTPAVVGYGYDTPDFPRKPWSFQREQVVAPKDLARFRPGMNVTVEYSQASSGASRLKGYGKARSVFLDELRLPFFLLLAFLIITAISWGKRMRRS